MSISSLRAAMLGGALLGWIPSALAVAQESAEPKVLTVDDYGSWRRVSSTISPDGSWVALTYSPNDGETTLTWRQLDGDITRDVERGTRPTFSPSSTHATYEVQPEKEGKDDSRKSVLVQLESGETTEFTGVRRSTFSPDGTYLALHRQAEAGSGDVVLVTVESGETHLIGRVDEFAFDEDERLLAYIVEAKDGLGNGVYIRDLTTGVTRLLDGSRDTFTALTWSEAGEHLAWMRERDVEGFERPERSIISLEHAGSRREHMAVYTPADDATFPEGHVLASSLSFSKDGQRLVTGVQRQREDHEPEPKDERPDVDVWHWNDAPVQSIQARRADRDRNLSHRAILHLNAGRLVILGDDTLRRVDVLDSGRWAIGRDDRAYRHEVSWGGSRADFIRIDVSTAERTPITTALGRSMGTSPDGRWLLFLKGGQVWSYDLDLGTTTDLSQACGVDFVRHEDDHPYEKPSYGIAGWSADGLSVVLNHRYDLWNVALDGSGGSCLTAGFGERDQVRYRVVRLDPEEETLDLAAPLLLSTYGEWTKKSGFSRLAAGEEPSVLCFDDVRYGAPRKAKESDRVLITRETFVACPDVWLTSTDFDSFEKISDANPQQADYAWGRRILVDYENSKGTRLQATLALPADYVEGQRYPMLVYFYEKMSQRHHQYSAPRYDDRPHMSTYASDGYLVLMPDVVYETGRPGTSAVDCVTSAAHKVIELGYADAERIALQGHSWGGYQSSFIVTQTDLFCAVVTGAPVTNLVSFHGELYKSSGSVQQGITERGQVRMGTSPWENMELYHSQSPLHNVRNITTPFMILHGTDDGSVDWHQGLEYYNAARRNGKEVILLSYPGEGHHLGRKANAIDFQVRMKQYFDHYCKDAPAPSWMTDGVPYLERDRARPRPAPPAESEEDENKPDDG